MKALATFSLVMLFTLAMSTESMAQRGGRGQGKGGGQSAQTQQTQPGQRGQNSQGRNGNGQGFGNQANGQGAGNRAGNGQGRNGQGQNGGTLTAVERTELIMMREEEKLARDVYAALQKKWKARIFGNIARAESQHMQALAGLLSRYQIPDPVVSNTPGTFTAPKFQQLYTALVTEGSDSQVAAFKVGLKIEEMDIADLRAAIQTTNNADLNRVYQQLERASQNHLRAFASQLRNAGGTYVATQLSQSDFDAVANSQNGQGGNGRGGAGQGGNGRGNGSGQGGAGRGKGPGQAGSNSQGGRGKGKRGG